MNEDEGPDLPHPPAWVVLVAINFISFVIVAALVLASVAVDHLLFQLG